MFGKQQKKPFLVITMSEPDYDAEIQPLLDYFLEFEMIELSDVISINETVYSDSTRYLLHERVPLESADPNYEIFFEVYNAIDSDSDTLSTHSESYMSAKATTESKAIENPTEESLKSLLESQFLSSEEDIAQKEYEKNVLAQKIRKEKYLEQRRTETMEQRFIRLEKKRAYQKKYLTKKKLLMAQKTSMLE